MTVRVHLECRNSQIIKIKFDIIEGGEDNQMFKSLEIANIWFSRFPYFKVAICIEFALLTKGNFAIECAPSIALVISSQLQIHCNSPQKFTIK